MPSARMLFSRLKLDRDCERAPTKLPLGESTGRYEDGAGVVAAVADEDKVVAGVAAMVVGVTAELSGETRRMLRKGVLGTELGDEMDEGGEGEAVLPGAPPPPPLLSAAAEAMKGTFMLEPAFQPKLL